MTDFPSKILHAEDDVMVHDMVKQALQRYENVELKYCNNGKELLDCTASFDPDLILLDLKMPNVNGPDTLFSLRENNPEFSVPIVFVTGYHQIKMCKEYARLGVIGVLHKPLSVGTFPERIRYMWNEYCQNLKKLTETSKAS